MNPLTPPTLPSSFRSSGPSRPDDSKSSPAASSGELHVREGMGSPTAMVLNPFDYGVTLEPVSPAFVPGEPREGKERETKKNEHLVPRGETPDLSDRRHGVIFTGVSPRGPHALSRALSGSPGALSASPDHKGGMAARGAHPGPGPGPGPDAEALAPMMLNPLLGQVEPAREPGDHAVPRGGVPDGRRQGVIHTGQTPQGPRAVAEVLEGSPAARAVAAPDDRPGPGPGRQEEQAPRPAARGLQAHAALPLPAGATREAIAALSMEDVVAVEHPYHAHLVAYLDGRFARENIDFITNVDAFMGASTPEAAQVLAERFVVEGSPQQVNLSSEAREGLVAALADLRNFQAALTAGRAEILKVVKENFHAPLLQHLQARLGD